MKIKENSLYKGKFPLFNLSFRPFFLYSSLFAILSMIIWYFIYILHFNLPIQSISSYQWHAHEMVYGYSMAVIAGFVLTAAKTWTGIQTTHGIPLFFLVVLWFLARLFLFFGAVEAACICDLLFIVFVTIALSVPVIQSKQWKQIAVVSKLITFGILNLLFYLGILGVIENGVFLGIYGGLYLVVGLILMMGRRVIPFFIEKGLGNTVKLHNSVIIDNINLILFIVFFVGELLEINQLILSYTALLLAVFNIIRLIGWYTNGLWQKPLLWSLYLAMWLISFGFILYYLSYTFGFSKFIAIHAFAYGGIGMITIGMMSRVSLGHTGRNIHNLPAGIKTAFLILLLGVFFRVLLPMLLPSEYLLWISIAMACWIIAFAIFFFKYYTILTKERIDGNFG